MGYNIDIIDYYEAAKFHEGIFGFYFCFCLCIALFITDGTHSGWWQLKTNLQCRSF
jgi:hypothetical protein